MFTASLPDGTRSRRSCLSKAINLLRYKVHGADFAFVPAGKAERTLLLQPIESRFSREAHRVPVLGRKSKSCGQCVVLVVKK